MEWGHLGEFGRPEHRELVRSPFRGPPPAPGSPTARAITVSELWSGTSWTSSLNTNIERSTLGSGPGGNSTAMLVTGGTISTPSYYGVEIYTGALPVIINLSGIPFVASGSELIQQNFPPPWSPRAPLLRPGNISAPSSMRYTDGVLHRRTVASFTTNSGDHVPFQPGRHPLRRRRHAQRRACGSRRNLIATLPMLQFSAILAERSGAA